MSVQQRTPQGQRSRPFAYFGLVCAFAVGAASAQIAAPATGIDSSGSYERERAACLNGATPQAQDTCLREAANAQADKRKGELQTQGQDQLVANAMRRCDALGGEDHAACTARVLGYGNQSGSVGGGGVIREVETVVVPPGQTEVTIEPKTDNPVLIVPR
ncbi:hypothetical protein [Pseudorhodoferax sp. Leaf274]|uniref:hypothetical protein n=1 Tax=Pseudorhodoferax sp. Leaf274 TaxID=1736318 RepID=UPI000702A21C|nr:hypothetical protein [Pseudorhodoferax sp. Leaf274]KQP43734.1 hypothetical protein ASF44_29680 [Pseudorhodoferax sp. Leaf274]